MLKKILILDAVVVVLVLAGIVWYVRFYQSIPHPTNTVNSFDECVNAHYPILETYPRQCHTPDGRSFIEEVKTVLQIPHEAKVVAPSANQIIHSPVTVAGEAVGTWYFEASFPIIVFDAHGTKLGQAGATAEKNWMTTSMVPYRATVVFATPTTATGYITLTPNDPSGLGKNKSQLYVPVRFETER